MTKPLQPLSNLLAQNTLYQSANFVQIYSPAHHFRRGAQSSQNASFLFRISVSKTKFMTLDDSGPNLCSPYQPCSLRTQYRKQKLCTNLPAQHIIFDAVHSLRKMPVSYLKLVSQKPMFMTLDDLDQTSAALIKLARSEHVPLKANSVQIYSMAHHFRRGAQSSQNTSFLFKISVKKAMFMTLDDLDQTSASLIKLTRSEHVPISKLCANLQPSTSFSTRCTVFAKRQFLIQN